MIADLGTMIRKEYQEILLAGGRRGRFSPLILLAVFGIFVPWQAGTAWVQSPLLAVFWLWVPIFLVTTVIADSFAGERERHTLETLLASRLSDRAILFGKLSAAVGYGWGLTMASLLLGLVTVNVLHPTGTLLVYPGTIALVMSASSLLLATLMGLAGILVSLRASTVRQAQQMLSIGIMALVLVPALAFQAVPQEVREGLGPALSRANFRLIIVAAVMGIIVLDALLAILAIGRFRRTRLILD